MPRAPGSWRIALAVALIACAAGCRGPSLPEAGDDAERLYVERCGTCHAAYNPRSMTAAMWAVQMDAMEPRMAQAGRTLSERERRAILDYLTRNAGG